MSATMEKQAWVDRVLFDGTGPSDFEMEATALRNRSGAPSGDFDTIDRLLVRLFASVQGAAPAASLSKLSGLQRTGGGTMAGALATSSGTFDSLGAAVVGAFASAVKGAPGTALAQLAALNAAPPNGAGVRPGAPADLFTGAITTGLNTLHATVVASHDLSALTNLSAMRKGS